MSNYLCILLILRKGKSLKALHARGRLKERLYVLNRNIFILFILFYKGIY